MNRFKLIYLCLIIGLSTTSFSQTASFDDILSIQLRDMGVIKNGTSISGYFMFYEIDKVDRKNRKFLLNILDENLNIVAKKNIINSKHTDLVDAAFNNQHIMLKFYDAREKTYSFKSYDLNGEKSKGAKRELKKKEYTKPIYMKGEGLLTHGNAFFAIPDQGFVQYASVKNKKWGYIIDFLGPDSKASWKYKSNKDLKELQFANYLVANEDMLLSNITILKNGFGKNAESGVLAIDVNTGKKIFEKRFGTKIPTEILNGYIDEEKEEIIVFGLYYKEGAKTGAKSKSKGLFAYTIGFDGKVKSKKYLSWDKDVSRHLKMNNKGKMDGGKYIHFHDIVKTADGKTLAVGEQFAKKIDGLGVAANIAFGGGFSVTKLTIEDVMIFQLDENLDLEDVKVFEKSKSDVQLDMDLYGPQVMAHFANRLGFFDYAFTQQNEDKSLITFGYVDYERRKGEKNGWTYGAISYIDNEFKSDKIKLDRKKKVSSRVLPAIPGYVLLAEYHRKNKTLDLKMEKINF